MLSGAALFAALFLISLYRDDLRSAISFSESSCGGPTATAQPHPRLPAESGSEGSVLQDLFTG